MHLLWEILAGLLPSIGIGYLFYRIMRTLLEGDRKERAAYARWQAEHDAAQAASAQSAAGNVGGVDESPAGGRVDDPRGLGVRDGAQGSAQN